MAARRVDSPLYSADPDHVPDRDCDLVHENHSALPGLGLDRSDGNDQPELAAVGVADPAVRVANRYSVPVCHPVLLGFGGLLDGADGLSAAADWTR